MRVFSFWRRLLIGLLVVTGLPLAVYSTSHIVPHGSVPSPNVPGAQEYRFTVSNGDKWTCAAYPGQPCADNCNDGACAITSAPFLDCVDLYCSSQPQAGTHWTVCSSGGTGTDYWECQNIVHCCVTMDEDCAAQQFGSMGGRAEQKPVIKVRPCKDQVPPDKFNANWLPTYGDYLCFEVSVNMPMEVLVELKSSTYEGMAMNAPLLPDILRTDDVSDIAPVSGVNGCTMQGPTFGADGQSHYYWQAPMDPQNPMRFLLRIQDFGAIGDFRALNTADWKVCDGVQIPPNYSRFTRNTDDDGDGLTAFEEYRGFMTQTACTAPDCHVRTSTDARDFNIKSGYPCQQQISYMLNHDGLFWGTWSLASNLLPGAQWPENHPYDWIDVNDRVGENLLVHNWMCDPPNFTNPNNFYQENYHKWHQGYIPRAYLLNTEGLVPPPDEKVTGRWIGWLPGRGCGNTDSLVVYRLAIDALMDFYANSNNGYYMPLSRWETYRDEFVDRDWVHEMGHALGLNDIETAGQPDCAMRQGSYIVVPSGDQSGDNWNSFHFYGTSISFLCGGLAGEPGLRP
ncbi:MAG TPA: hypothetical protein VGL38_08215 [bacterium]|jgi:hypothetical protein